MSVGPSVRRSVGPSVRPSVQNISKIVSGFHITAPAQPSATGLPCIQPCFFVVEIFGAFNTVFSRKSILFIFVDHHRVFFGGASVDVSLVGASVRSTTIVFLDFIFLSVCKLLPFEPLSGLVRPSVCWTAGQWGIVWVHRNRVMGAYIFGNSFVLKKEGPFDCWGTHRWLAWPCSEFFFRFTRI